MPEAAGPFHHINSRHERVTSASFWTWGTAEAPRKLRWPLLVYPELGRMLAFAPFQGFIRGMSVEGARSMPSVAGFQGEIGLS
jgi:hypothetical protein